MTSLEVDHVGFPPHAIVDFSRFGYHGEPHPLSIVRGSGVAASDRDRRRLRGNRGERSGRDRMAFVELRSKAPRKLAYSQ